MSRKRAGFTLLELMIVIFILAILMAMMIPNWVKAKYRAHLSGCMQNERAIATAMEVYRTEHDSYPPPGPISPGHVLFTARFITPGDIRCPSNQSFYTLEANNQSFTLVCNGIHHLLLPVTVGYPQYTNVRGIQLQ